MYSLIFSRSQYHKTKNLYIGDCTQVSASTSSRVDVQIRCSPCLAPLCSQRSMTRCERVTASSVKGVNSKEEEPMKAATLIEIMQAAHLSRFVPSPFGRRSGILLVGPPGILKTTLINCAISDYHDALCLSDINVQQLMVLKDDISAGRYHTLALYAMEKLYQRHSSTASNVEGSLQAMVEEGFTEASFNDQRRPSMVAKCLVIGGITDSLHRKKFPEWMESGFARRFLHCFYRMEDHSILMDAIENWEPIVMDGISSKWPANKVIPKYGLSPEEKKMIRHSLRFQPGDTSPFQLCIRLYCVLRWKYNQKKAISLFEDFSECLGQRGAVLTV